MNDKIQAWIDAIDYASGFISAEKGKVTAEVETLHQIGMFLTFHFDEIVKMQEVDEQDNGKRT